MSHHADLFGRQGVVPSDVPGCWVSTTKSPSTFETYSVSRGKKPTGIGFVAKGLCTTAEGSVLYRTLLPLKSTAQIADTMLFRGSRKVVAGTVDAFDFGIK